MNEKLENLIQLASYFRGALKDETSLPENPASMSKLIVVNKVDMVQLSPKSTHYRQLLNNIEEELETIAYQLISNKETVEVKTKKKDTKTLVIDAETSINKTSENIGVEALMPKKETDKSKPIYGSLLTMPEGVITQEDTEYLITKWHKSKGTNAKAELYAKVRDILNNQDLPIRLIKSELAKFVQKIKKSNKTENEVEFVSTLHKEGIDFNINIKPDDLISGEKLLDGKTQYQKDGEFNLLLLTGKDTVDNVSPQDYVKLRSMWLRITGRERQAIDEITKFYSDTKKGTIWTPEQAGLFLNNLFRVNGFNLLRRLIENILVYKEETKDSYKTGLKQAKNLLRAYTRYSVEKKGKDGTKAVTQRTWPDHKINNFLDKIILKLADAGKIKVEKKKIDPVAEKKAGVETDKSVEEKVIYTVKYKKNDKGKYEGRIEGGSVNTDISNYVDEVGFKKACEVIAKASSTNYEIKYFETVAVEEGSKKDATFHTEKKDEKSVVSADKKTGNFNASKKTVNIKLNKPKSTSNSAEKYEKTQKEKELLKLAKKAVKQTFTNIKKTPKTEKPKKPQYSAIISKEKDGTFTCRLVGFENAVETKGSTSLEDAKKDFYEALMKYSERIKLENEKARASHKKGKMLHLKPDFTKGELIFLSKETGT